jgi:hypothetical protein
MFRIAPAAPIRNSILITTRNKKAGEKGKGGMGLRKV